MRIGKAAKSAGVSVETIRFYERQGLISQPSTPVNGGFRSYPSETVDYIRFIRRAQDFGFSLKEIDELFSLRADPSTDCADIRARASMKLEDMKVRIARLVAIQSVFQDLVSACPGRGVAARDCPILVALETHEIDGAPAEQYLETEP
jgi:MerR family mercuric resistance operon transcriptional regulator